MNEIKLREYQKSAVAAFFNNNGQGILEMATGTGKTLTALYCAQKAYEKDGRQFLVIIVPFLHLIEQWGKDFPLVDIKDYLIIANSQNTWVDKLKQKITEFNFKFTKRGVVIGSYQSTSTNTFKNIIKDIKDDQFLIADECHYLGALNSRENPYNKFTYKLGLSATPKRWLDEEGTQVIYHLFEKSIFTYSMEQAIENHYLTQYYYYPKTISLNNDEVEKYKELTKRIARLVCNKNLDYEQKLILKNYLIKRSDVIQKAHNKLPLLLRLLQEQADHRFTLIYCGKGEIDKIVKTVSELNIRVHRFNSEISAAKRKQILSDFAKGNIEILVAIKCLDEGVDVPATKTAYFLASTSSPREFIQRRGRILRRYQNKEYSVIYDFIVLQDDKDHKIVESIVRKELPRFVEFSRFAINKSQARSSVEPFLEKNNLENYLDLLPWDIIKNEI